MREPNGFYIYCTEYKHARSGKIMRASDYGKKAWRFWVSRRKK